MALPQIESGIRDNHVRGTVADFLREHTREGANLSVVSAYFTIYAYEALKEHLDQIGHMDFLFGEPRLRALDPDKTDKKAFVIEGDGLTLANALEQKRVARECAEWIRTKVAIRSVKQASFLHGKMYHLAHDGTEHAIVGSSNFTTRGLGLSPTNNNIELNLIVNDNRDRADLKRWFDTFWNDSTVVQDVKDDVLEYLARLYENHSPEFIYYKTLFHLFEKYLGDTGRTDADLGRTTLLDSAIWRTLFSFQRDGAKSAINKILSHNGCILADSVGLGKTYTALAVIKYFELRNERVLVLCPKKLERNWTIYRTTSRLNPFDDDRFRYDVLAHTDVSRERGLVNGLDLSVLNWGNYDLVVIDESHNFRNNAIARSDPKDPGKRTRYQSLMEDIISAGVRTKVLLLSATPVNNQLADLRNQISFVAGGDVARDQKPDSAFSDTLGIASVRETSRMAQSHFTAWAKKPANERKTRDLLAALGGDFFKLLDGLSIARSRHQIATYYADEMKRLGGFPHRPKPRSISPTLDLKGGFPSFEDVHDRFDVPNPVLPDKSKIRLALYHPTSFLRPDLPEQWKSFYQDKILGGFTQEGRERILIAMMKINFLKRLESSVHSFRLTLERTIEKIDTLAKRIRDFEKHQDANPDLDYDSLTPDLLEDPDFETEEFTIGGRRRIHLAHLDRAKWMRAVLRDRAHLQSLLDMAAAVTPDRDGKLADLRQIIREKVTNPTTNRDGEINRKVLVFTAFADTATYLYQQLVHWAHKELGIHVSLVTGSGANQTTLGRADYDDILTNFAPRAKRRAQQPAFPQTEEVDLLIATDCISEGQNLQDCDLLVNYDIHWNPVRIIQRFGRIDRIGSRNNAVQLVNFWPVADLDRYINVKHRVEARMALVDLAATQTDNLLDPGQIEELIREDLLFRDRQLKRLKDEVLDLEDLDDAVSLSDFTLDDFRTDLLNYLDSHKDLEEAPFGLYALVPAFHDLVSKIGPGVIYCLRRKACPAPGSPTNPSEQVNPLDPFFLVYVLDDGNVRYNFAHPKQVLTIYRLLCSGKTVPYEDLCNLFDRETQNGQDMAAYSTLLEKAVLSIAQTFRRRVAGGLQSGRSFVIPNEKEQASETSDFQLVTWLVIKQP